MAASQHSRNSSPRFSSAASPATGLRSGLYSTPRSNSSASLARLGRSDLSGTDSTTLPFQPSSSCAGGSRKRARPDASARPASPSHNHRNLHSTHLPSPPALANTSFRLAGGRESPSSFSPRDSTIFDDRDFRRAWSPSAASTSSSDGRRTFSLGALDREHNGRKRSQGLMAAQSESWAQYVFRLAGGFAGIVWDFCKPDAFQGFAAGGGTAYAMTDGAPQRLTPQRKPLNYPHLRYGDDEDMRSTPVPGGFPTDDEDYYVKVSGGVTEEEQGRPSKRQQTSQGNDWVVVDQPRAFTSAYSPANVRPVPGSPHRSPKIPRPAVNRTTPLRRPRSLTSTRASVASPSTASPSRASMAGSTTFDRPRTASFAPQRSPQATPPRSPQSSPRARQPSLKPSPSSVEIQRFSARRDRQERQADASMRRLNSQLKAMIREGQAALASPVGFDDMLVDDEDEGYGEGDYDQCYTKI